MMLVLFVITRGHMHLNDISAVLTNHVPSMWTPHPSQPPQLQVETAFCVFIFRAQCYSEDWSACPEHREKQYQ